MILLAIDSDVFEMRHRRTNNRWEVELHSAFRT